MQDLYIDIETYSSVSLSECGVYRYAEAKDSELLLFGYSIDKLPIEVIELARAIFKNKNIDYLHKISIAI